MHPRHSTAVVRLVRLVLAAVSVWSGLLIDARAWAQATAAPAAERARVDSQSFPPELTQFAPYADNPVFTAGGEGKWDVKIRERGWIIRDGDRWRMWYTGYDGTRPGLKMLGLATSTDGLNWKPDPRNPIYRQHWCEDMMVVKEGDTYYMFAEGADDVAQLLTSPDGVAWTRVGPLDIRTVDGKPLSAGPYGTPTALRKGETWYLFYERMDRGIWLATSPDMKVWCNVQDEPVLTRGPEAYDQHAVALNQVIEHDGAYYAYYHGSDTPEWREWSVNLARSDDLVHWQKYPRNPVLGGNQSSGIVVKMDDGKYRLYAMHGEVRAYLPKE